MPRETIFVDESGNAGLKKSHSTKYPFFIMGFTFCNDPQKLKVELGRAIRKLHRRSKYAPKLKELKFYPKPALEKLGYTKDEISRYWEPHFPEIRHTVTSLITQHCDGVFAGVLDKRTIWKSTWTPERIGNYLFNKSVYQYILPNLVFANPPDILHDRGRISGATTQSFHQYMLGTDSWLSYSGGKRYSGNIVKIKEVDSIFNSGIWASDFVAGSFRHSFLYGDSTYVSMLKPKFIGNGFLKLW